MAYEVERTEDFGKGYLQEIPEMQVPSSPAAAGFAGMSTAVAREVAQVQGQIMMAKMFPRDLAKVEQSIKIVCSRKHLAEQALYTYARGGTNISGPTIRLAEAVAAAYGNIKAGYEVVESDADQSRIRAFAYDMESNTVMERNFDVPHIRETKKGRTRLTDPRDIYETIANNASRRVRACILQVLPGDVVELAVDTCKDTLRKNVDTSAEAREALLKAFASMGVSKTMIEARIQRKMEAITADLVIDLRGVYASIRDGIGSIDDFFDREAKPIGAAEEQPAKAEPQHKTTAKKTAAKAQHAAEPAPAPQPEPAPATEGSMAMDDEGISAAFDAPMAGPESFDEDDSLEGFYDRA